VSSLSTRHIIYMGLDQPTNRELELAKIIPEIGKSMAMIELMPIDFTKPPSGVEIHEEAVCNIIAYVLQQYEHLGDDGEYEGFGMRRIREALIAELQKGTRYIGNGFTTSKKLMAWLGHYQNFCQDIPSSIRSQVRMFLESAHMSVELNSPTHEERMKMIEEARQELKKMSSVERINLLKEIEQDDILKTLISQIRLHEELSNNTQKLLEILVDNMVFIRAIANNLVAKNRRMQVSELTGLLNHPNYDVIYSHEQGTIVFIFETWNSLTKLGRHNEANNVANAFVDEYGEPWKKD